VIYEGRKDGMNQWKSAYAIKTPARTLADALKGADVFFGLSAKGAVTKEMVDSMAAKPIIFAMANPDPEITARESRGAQRRHHGDRALGLSEPGQQRARITPTSSAARSTCAPPPSTWR
jgi:malic enzyme